MRILAATAFSILAILALVSCQDAGTPTGAAQVTVEIPGIVNIKSAKEFDDYLATSKELVVVDFHAEWCGPCKRLAPELEALVKANPGKLAVLKVDVDQNPGLAQRFNVSSIPVLIKMVGGKEAAREVGFGGKEKLAAFVGLK